MCGGVLPCHLSQAGEGSVLLGGGVDQGLTDPASVPLWADPIGGYNPGHFVPSAIATPSQDSPLGGARRTLGVCGRTAPLLSVYSSGQWWTDSPSCCISMGEPVCLSGCQSSSQRTLLEGFVPFFPSPSLLSRILAWASEPPPSLSYIGLAGLGV